MHERSGILYLSFITGSLVGGEGCIGEAQYGRASWVKAVGTDKDGGWFALVQFALYVEYRSVSFELWTAWCIGNRASEFCSVLRFLRSR